MSFYKIIYKDFIRKIHQGNHSTPCTEKKGFNFLEDKICLPFWVLFFLICKVICLKVSWGKILQHCRRNLFKLEISQKSKPKHCNYFITSLHFILPSNFQPQNPGTKTFLLIFLFSKLRFYVVFKLLSWKILLPKCKLWKI